MVRPCLVLLGLGVCLLGVSDAYSNKAVGLDLPNSGRRNERGLHKHATTRREQLMELTPDQLVDVLLQFDAMPVSTADTAYWWRYNNSDCAYHDLPEASWCMGESLSSCKAKCLATDGCGGFNFPHGVLKKTECSQHIAPSSTTLYIIESKPQPPPPPPASTFPPVWPVPASFTNGSDSVLLDSHGFKFTSSVQSADLSLAFDRILPLMFPHSVTATGPAAAAAVSACTVTVASASGELQLETDESYTLSLASTGCVITAPTVFGAMHALQTLSQLVVFDFDTQQYGVAAAPWEIIDVPRFKHREVLIDSARHFEPVPTIMALIESLTFAKINVVHWHLVDSQSFPFDSPSLPLLSRAGAYSAQERFTVNDVADVVEFARARGVRVMVEIDTPGHAGSWCLGHPEICPSPTCTQPLNPATEATFELLTKLFGDLTGGARGKGLFPENLIHLGGDEVNTDCWTQSPNISAWLKSKGLTADGGYAFFVNRTSHIALGMGRDVVAWEEVWDHFGTRLDKSTIIHQWLPGSTIAQNATSHGYRCLWSTDGVWYLDGLSSTWETMYAQEPCTGIDDATCEKLVLGGGGAMWGETVDTSDIQQTVWPRLAAIAERLWSPKSAATTPDNARARFSAFRCLLNRRGIAAAPANNKIARGAPPGPGGCLAQ